MYFITLVVGRLEGRAGPGCIDTLILPATNGLIRLH